MLKDYNTSSKRLILPEYGRTVQNMVDFCVALPEREERQRCAEAIVKIMKAFLPPEKEREDYRQMLWDHLNIMSDFKLDIDFPYPQSEAQEFATAHHERIPYDRNIPMYRHYGVSIEKMIEVVSAMPDGEERQKMAQLVATQMKRSYVLWNKDNVDDIRIFTDLYEMSEGKIYLDEYSCRLPDAKQITSLANNNSQVPKRTNNKKKRR